MTVASDGATMPRIELAQHARAHLGFLRDIGQAQASLLSQRAKAAAQRDQRPIEVRFGLSSGSVRVLLSDRAILEQRHEGIFAAALDSGLGDPVAYCPIVSQPESLTLTAKDARYRLTVPERL